VATSAVPQLPEHLPPFSTRSIFTPEMQPKPVEALEPETAMDTLPAPTGTVYVAIACLPVERPFNSVRDNADPTGHPRPSEALAPDTDILRVPEVGGTVKFAAKRLHVDKNPPQTLKEKFQMYNPYHQPDCFLQQ